MGRITIDQSHAIMATLVANTKWGEIDFAEAGLEDLVIRNAREAGDQFTAFLKNGGRVIVGLAETKMTPELAIKRIIDLDADPFIPEGWEIEEHIKGGQFEWNPVRVARYLSEQQQGGKAIQGHKLREELKGKPVYNVNLLDWYLKNSQFIPAEWKGKWVFFWGTIYRASDDGLCVRCLGWDGSWWRWSYRWLDRGFRGSGPAAVPASI